MKISLLAFAMLRDLLPSNPLEYEIPEGCTAEELIRQLAREFPAMSEILMVTRLAHQEDYVSKSTVLQENTEYCLIPPVSGG